MKLAALEAMWHTEPAPAAFTAIGIPDLASRTTHYALHIPWAMGLIGTRSLTTEIPGITELVEHAKARIRNGLVAYAALERIKVDRKDEQARAEFARTQADLGYAKLLTPLIGDPLRRPRPTSPGRRGRRCRTCPRCSSPSGRWWPAASC